MSELLLEVFSEEVPAKMQAKAAEDIKIAFVNHLIKNKIQYKILNSFVTPRRLAVHCEGIRYSEAVNQSNEKRGPKVGADERAIEGFIKSSGVSKKDLIVKNVKGVEYYFANISAEAMSLEDVLSGIVEKILKEFSWPKSMRWDESNVTWIRPIRNLLCLFDGKILPIKFGTLSSNNSSFGHRFLSPKEFQVNSFKDYAAKLESHKVVLSREERKKIILAQIDEILSKKDLELVQDAELLDEVVGLVEYPVAVLGEMNKSFLELPKEILTTTIKVHQKYFSLQTKEGELAPYFITVSNNDPEDKRMIIAGNELVLKARLYDAEFSFKEDKKVTLESRVEKLKNIVFHKKLGTVFNKSERTASIAEKLAAELKITNISEIKRAALLSKTDLLTNMVGEFPDLQGVVGKYYAQYDKESKVVSESIYEHYLPRGRHDRCPSLKEAAVLSIADKIDSIVGLFLIGESPTSSKDPYGVRRSALGIIRILMESKFSIDLHKMISIAMSVQTVSNSNSKSVADEIYTFFLNRFKFLLKEDYNESLISAVLNKSSGDLYTDFIFLKDLSEYLITPGGKSVYYAMKRTINILDSVKENIEDQLNEKKLSTDIEKKLYNSINEVEKEVVKFLDKSSLLQAMKATEGLAIIIDEFFDKTMIMVEDVEVKNNRIVLLKKIRALFENILDFSVIEL